MEVDFTVDRADADGAGDFGFTDDDGEDDGDGDEDDCGAADCGAGSGDSVPATRSVTPAAAGSVSDFCADTVDRIP